VDDRRLAWQQRAGEVPLPLQGTATPESISHASSTRTEDSALQLRGRRREAIKGRLACWGRGRCWSVHLRHRAPARRTAWQQATEKSSAGGEAAAGYSARTLAQRAANSACDTCPLCGLAAVLGTYVGSISAHADVDGCSAGVWLRGAEAEASRDEGRRRGDSAALPAAAATPPVESGSAAERRLSLPVPPLLSSPPPPPRPLFPRLPPLPESFG
jgi:hypothetical protein